MLVYKVVIVISLGNTSLESLDIVVSVSFSLFLFKIEETLLDMLFLVAYKQLEGASETFNLLGNKRSEVLGLLWRHPNILRFERGDLGLDWLDEVKLFWTWDGSLENLGVKLVNFLLKRKDVVLESFRDSFFVWERIVFFHLSNQSLGLKNIGKLDTDISLGLLSNMLLGEKLDSSIKCVVVVGVVVA